MTRPPACAACASFRDQADFLARELPGLASLSSPHAAVRGTDGLCLHHSRLVGAADSCPAFERCGGVG